MNKHRSTIGLLRLSDNESIGIIVFFVIYYFTKNKP